MSLVGRIPSVRLYRAKEVKLLRINHRSFASNEDSHVLEVDSEFEFAFLSHADSADSLHDRRSLVESNGSVVGLKTVAVCIDNIPVSVKHCSDTEVARTC